MFVVKEGYCLLLLAYPRSSQVQFGLISVHVREPKYLTFLLGLHTAHCRNRNIALTIVTSRQIVVHSPT